MSLSKKRPTFLRFVICLVIGMGLSFGLLFYANAYYEEFMGRTMLRSGYYLVAAIAGLVIALFLVFPANKPLRIFKWLGRLLVMLVVVALIFAAGTILEVQNDMMFYPGNRDTEDETALKQIPQVEEVGVKSGKLTYRGYFYKQSTAKAPTIIYFGGNGELAASRMYGLINYGLKDLLLANVNFLVVDYPGYGQSEGEPRESTLKDMAKATMDYALSREEVDKDKIILMGWSLGTGSATYLAAEYEVAGLVLAAPFYNGTTLVNGFIHNQMHIEDTFYTNLPTFLVSNKFPSNEYAKKIDEPVLVLGASNDEVIPHEQAERLSREFKTAQYIQIEGGHSAVISDPPALQAILAFIGNILGQTFPVLTTP